MSKQTGHYTVLARRYRPQTFDEVVGQQHVATALKNAIDAGRVAHAYLFTGARGVGKTSMARILAKALNCPQSEKGVPCNTCDICEGISAGRDIDILEIDGASNRGIDDIRALRANVNVKSMRTQFKMYIIDEVHMLTKEAFNALLKTLEEPPPNVKFVFCTTEPNKVPDTILSRCQRFDFASIETHRIAERLASIAKQEGMSVDSAAIDLVARRAGGSMRDSQSLFDQLLAFSSDQITVEDVNRLLGTAGDERLIALFQTLITREAAKIFTEVEIALHEGVQLVSLVDQLLEYLRDLLAIASGAEDISLLSVQDYSRDTLKSQANAWGLATIAAAMQILSDTRGKMARIANARPIVELALVRILMLEDLDSLKQILESLQSGTPLQVAGRDVSAEIASATVVNAGAAAQQQLGATTSTSPAPPVKKNIDHSTTEHRSEPKNDHSAISSTQAVPESQNTHEPTQEEPITNHAPDGTDDSQENNIVEEGRAVENVPSASPDEADSTTNSVAIDPATIKNVWQQSIQHLDESVRGHLAGISDIKLIDPNRLELTFPQAYRFSKEYFDKKPESVSLVERAIEQTTGQRLKIQLRLDLAASPNNTNAEPTHKEILNAKNNARKIAEKDPYVKMVGDLFGARIVSATPLENTSEENAPG